MLAVNNSAYGSDLTAIQSVTASTAFTASAWPDLVLVGSAATAATTMTIPNAAGLNTWRNPALGQFRLINNSSFAVTISPASGSVVGSAVVAPGAGITLQVVGGSWTNSGGAASASSVSTNLTTVLAADVTNATATMSNLTALSQTLAAAATYKGRFVAKCSDSTAAEGISFDFDGGAATAAAFAAGASLITGGTTVAVTTVSSALATDFNWTTITGETWIAIDFTITTTAGGTFLPRFCQGTAHTSGTATASRGTSLSMTRIS